MESVRVSYTIPIYNLVNSIRHYYLAPNEKFSDKRKFDKIISQFVSLKNKRAKVC